MKRLLLLFGALMAINGSAYATIMVSATVTGDPAESNYFNSSNSIVVTVTLEDDAEGDHATDYNVGGNGRVYVYVNFASSNSGTPSNSNIPSGQANDGGIDNGGYNNDNVATITISNGDLLQHGQGALTEDQKPFDLYLKKLTNTVGGDLDGGYTDINFTFDSGLEPTLIYDVTSPGVDSWIYPENSDFVPDAENGVRGEFARTEAQKSPPVYRDGWPFNLQKVMFNPSEQLYNPDDAASSLKS
mgnify:FL=1